MVARILSVAAYLVGVGGASLFFAWVFARGIGVLPRADDVPGDAMAWVVDVGLLLLFAVQHSGMARRSFKRWSARWIPASLERSLYVAAAGVAVSLMAMFWRPLPGEPIWHGPVWIAAIGALAALGLTCCCAWFDHAAFLGLTPAWTGAAPARGPLRIVGPFRYVRHPQMLGVAIALWSQPILLPEMALMNAGWMIYIAIAIGLEERDLLRDYGPEYDAYRKRTPALIPYRIFV